MADDQTFTGYFIPVEILNDTQLKATDKLLLAEIDALGKKGDGCYASNAHLGRHVDMTGPSVRNALSRLRQLGYIETTRFDGRTRWIRAKLMNSGAIKELQQVSSGYDSSCHPTMNININRNISTKKESSIDRLGTTRARTREETERPPPPKRKKISEFLEALRADESFDGIDVDVEYEKARDWCIKKNRPLNQRFFLQWLEKADRDDLEDDDEVGSWAVDEYYSWKGWTEERRRALLELWPGTMEPPQRWDKVSPDIKQLIEARVKEGWG